MSTRGIEWQFYPLNSMDPILKISLPALSMLRLHWIFSSFDHMVFFGRDHELPFTSIREVMRAYTRSTAQCDGRVR
jgi:hypothetical protein